MTRFYCEKWELNDKITKINLNNSIKSNNIIIKGYGGNNKRLTKGTMYLSEIKDDHVYLLKKDGSYTIGGDSGAPYFNDKNELIAVHNGILGNKEKMFGTTIESIKNVLLEKINNWNYPTEVEIEDFGIVEIQNLSLDNKVDESYIEGDIEIIQSKSTCNNEIIEPYKTCYYFVKTNGNYGKINIDNNNFIEINKNKKINDEIKEPIEKSENKKSGGSINYLSLIFLLLFIKRKKHI